MSIGHDSNKINAKRNADLARIDIYLERIQSTLDEFPSEYRTTVELITKAHSEVLRNVRKAGKLTAKAYHAAVDESTLVVEYHRIVDRITPEDPVLKENKVTRCIEEYKLELRKNNLKAARKALRKLDKAIGGRGESTSMTIRLLNSKVPKGESEATIIISNIGKKDIIINSISSYSTMKTDHVELIEPVIRAGNSINQNIRIYPDDVNSAIINLSVTYTKDLLPITQKFVMKVLVE